MQRFPYGGPELLKKFKESKNAFIVSDLKKFKFCDVPSNVVRTSKKLGEADAYLMESGEVTRIKVLEEE